MIQGLYEAHLPVSDLNQSIEFYQNIGLELAYRNKSGIAFFWIEKGKSWIGLWEGEEFQTPYHPSLRHIAFRVELNDIKKAKDWLSSRGIVMRENFGFAPKEPIVLDNPPQAHAAIYFHDPDRNSLEFICPVEIDTYNESEMMYLSEWEQATAQGEVK
ncbi:VOC family protein [Tuberibacillus sp. Marseille-P3662]|uniref:VOC family protein n=1 Tax=Tuberibacillus sp. Marseille-P3662 TaxID=1965358 RepID=UPI000A1CC619|nr:VOC family protein [Tuberibacillus sp. Marseille-P3662]